MKKIERIYQELNLIRMSIVTIRRQINDQLDTIDIKIANLIPEEEGRGRHIHSLEEVRQMITDACLGKHRKRISTKSGRKRRTKT